MNRIDLEKAYWNANAQDPDVDIKYISDVDTKLCLEDLGKMTGEVLEIGCGVGRLLKPEYWGIDTSEKMIDIALARGAGAILLTDGRTIPFKENKFDYIYCYLVFQHLPYEAVEGYIKEAYRVLKPKGKFIFQFIIGEEHEDFSNHYSIDEIKSMASQYKKMNFKPSVAHTSWVICELEK